MSKPVPVFAGTSQYRRGRVRFKHIEMAEAALGRPLPEGTQVHHVNGDKGDNRPSNLVVCQDAAYHMLLHVRARVLRLGGNPNTDRICTACHQPCPMLAMSGNDRRGRICRPCHNERARIRAARRYREHHDRINAERRAYRRANPEQVRAADRARYHAEKAAQRG